MSDGGRSCGLLGLKSAVEGQFDLLDLRGVSPGLYLVPTPIGNLSDITLRALHTLAAADLICAEDTRHSARLLQHYRIENRVRSYHDHSSEAQRAAIVDMIANGQSVALISDAGTPLISDPGYKLVRDVLDAGYSVISLPGASAVLPALTASGLPSDAFFFAGFLPAKSAARIKRLRALTAVPATLIFYEAPGRIGAVLSDLADVFGPREGCVVRELSKQFEEAVRGSLHVLAETFASRNARGECVVVVGPPEDQGDVSDDEIIERLKVALNGASVRDATRVVMDELSVPKSRVYRFALNLAGEKS